MSEQGVGDEGHKKISPDQAVAELHQYIYKALPSEAPKYRAAGRRWRELHKFHLEKYGQDSIFSILPEDVGSRNTQLLTGALLNLFRKRHGSERISVLAGLPGENLDAIPGIGPNYFALIKEVKGAAEIVFSERGKSDQILP